jgi:hypothetical protein
MWQTFLPPATDESGELKNAVKEYCNLSGAWVYEHVRSKYLPFPSRYLFYPLRLIKMG